MPYSPNPADFLNYATDITTSLQNWVNAGHGQFEYGLYPFPSGICSISAPIDLAPLVNAQVEDYTLDARAAFIGAPGGTFITPSPSFPDGASMFTIRGGNVSMSDLHFINGAPTKLIVPVDLIGDTQLTTPQVRGFSSRRCSFNRFRRGYIFRNYENINIREQRFETTRGDPSTDFAQQSIHMWNLNGSQNMWLSDIDVMGGIPFIRDDSWTGFDPNTNTGIGGWPSEGLFIERMNAINTFYGPMIRRGVACHISDCILDCYSPIGTGLVIAATDGRGIADVALSNVWVGGKAPNKVYISNTDGVTFSGCHIVGDTSVTAYEQTGLIIEGVASNINFNGGIIKQCNHDYRVTSSAAKPVRKVKFTGASLLSGNNSSPAGIVTITG